MIEEKENEIFQLQIEISDLEEEIKQLAGKNGKAANGKGTECRRPWRNSSLAESRAQVARGWRSMPRAQGGEDRHQRPKADREPARPRRRERNGRERTGRRPNGAEIGGSDVEARLGFGHLSVQKTQGRDADEYRALLSALGPEMDQRGS